MFHLKKESEMVVFLKLLIFPLPKRTVNKFLLLLLVVMVNGMLCFKDKTIFISNETFYIESTQDSHRLQF